MKNYHILLFVLCFSLIGCSESKSKIELKGAQESQTVEGITKTTPEATLEATSEATSEVKIEDSIEYREAYIGSWEIKREMNIVGKVVALDDQDVKQMIGKKIIYSSEYASYDQLKISKPFYKTESVSEDDFFVSYKASLKDLGIKLESVTQVEVYTDPTSDQLWDSTGNTLILTDDRNTMFMYVDGVFFELKRIK